LSLIYGLVTGLRNWLFDQEILKSTSFEIPIISVGNIAVGGTGKTPHAEFILSVLQSEWKLALLSRGYKRLTKGFRLATNDVSNLTIGDEPFQIFSKFPNVAVAVDEKRVNGVKKLQELIPDLQAIVLDDAFQHRYIQAGLSILLTDYSNLYSRDYVMPVGDLREWKSASKRADIVVVTKCPIDIKPIDLRVIETELNIENNQCLFFSSFIYDELIPVFPDSIDEILTYNQLQKDSISVLLVAGIVSPEPIMENLRKYNLNFTTLIFPDHYTFQVKDFLSIQKKYDALNTDKKIILLTEKDAARIVANPSFPASLKSSIYAIPIRVQILQNKETIFNQKLKNYVVENTRNSRFSKV